MQISVCTSFMPPPNSSPWQNPIVIFLCSMVKLIFFLFLLEATKWNIICWIRVDSIVFEGVGYEDKGGFANLQVPTEKGLLVFTFKQLHSATGGFSKSNVVGHGGFGLVYCGVLSDGRKVAIKFMDQAGKQGEDEFKVEVCSQYICCAFYYINKKPREKENF